MQETMDRLGMTKRDTATIALGGGTPQTSLFWTYLATGQLLP